MGAMVNIFGNYGYSAGFGIFMVLGFISLFVVSGMRKQVFQPYKIIQSVYFSVFTLPSSSKPSKY